jgi:3'-5' exoribonuclease
MADRNKKKVIDLKPGDIAEGYFYIKVSEQKQTTTNNRYMNFTFADNTGEINAKLWDWDDDNVTRFAAGTVVWAKGQVIDWQGQLQFKIDRIRRTVEADNVNPEEFIPSAPYQGEEMYEIVEKTVLGMENAEIATLVMAVLEKYKNQLIYFPAAKKNHHSVRCGLLYHITTMLKNAKALSETYDFLNKDLLYAGVILHDIGKIEEMEVSEYGIVSDYTTEGIMLGHLIQCIKIVSETGNELGINSEIIMLLEHMILAHHYEPEYGSPKYPMIPEAEMLHYLDVMDARMYDMAKAYETTDTGKFSERIWSLNNRQVYRHDVKKG